MFDFPAHWLRRLALCAVAAFFTFAGIGHFTNTAFFVAIMPPWLPAHVELVHLSGIFEILGGVGVLFARSRTIARYGLLALLVAVYPANLHMALHPEAFPDLSVAALYLRLAMQFVIAGIVWWATGSEPAGTTPPDPHA